ncbi:MAG: HNH endonuclease [Gemmataceae bacterium]|nr:HNH endonuclease [Gemmataceae bacterium]
MSGLAPFAYATTAHVRLHLPRGYDSVEAFKQWLRDEFRFRCTYCLERERWYPDGHASFSVDHVVARSLAAALVREYSNLLYACTRCNSYKGDRPLLDPTAVAMADHLRLGEDGSLVGTTLQGKVLIRLLRLNEDPSLSTRRDKLSILRLRERYPGDPDIAALFLQAFGYPDDLPDLRRTLPPGGNDRAGSEDDCHFARRERGELPAVY